MTLRRLELATSWGPLTIVGGSRAGDGTLLLLPQLRLALDPGRPHRGLPPMTTVTVSHGHMDHVAGLGYWASQRHLNAMGRGTLIAPADIAGQLQRLLGLHAALEGGRAYDVDLLPVADGDRHHLRADVELEFFATDHWVPTMGLRLVWTKRRLLPALAGLSGEEIALRRRAGERVSEEQRLALLSYCADTGPQLLARRPETLVSEVVLLECSFFRPSDRDRAGRFGHLHLDDLLARSRTFGCRHLVLLHASRRHRLREVEAILDERLRPALDCELHHLIIDWE